MSRRHRPRRLLAQHPSENSDSLDMSRVRDDSSEVHAGGWSAAELHLRNAGPRPGTVTLVSVGDLGGFVG